MSRIGTLALAYLYAVFLAAVIPGLCGDYLFYRSDFFSLLVMTLAAAVMLLPVTLLAALLISFLPRQACSFVSRWSALLAAIGIVDLFLAIGFLYLIGLFRWNRLISATHHPLVVIVMALLPAAALVLLHRDRDGLIVRISHVGISALICAPLLAGWSVLSAWSRVPSDTAHRRQLVMIVLDAWPSQHLHVYNPQAPRSALDDVLPQARVFDRAYTSAVWTGGYFATLYNGAPGAVAGNASDYWKKKSLGAALQDKGVGVRLMNFHRNGIPDASAARRHDHRGFRSYYLTENYAWIPAALGLDYHLTLSGHAISQALRQGVPLALFDWLNPVPAEQRRNAFTQILMPELRRMRHRYRDSFTLFHTRWHNLGRGRGGSVVALPKAQASGEPDPDLVKRIRANDYRYPPEAEPQAALRRSEEAAAMQLTATLIKEFLVDLRADPAFRDVTVVLTADHGSMYAKGRYWYAYHPHREVVQVPFLVFGPGSKGVDHALFATPSVTQAILNFFDRPDAQNEFAPKGDPHGAAVSLTFRSDLHKEWMLVITRRDRTYWLNLHPKGPGTTREVVYDGYDGRTVSESAGPPHLPSLSMAELIESFGIDISQVHSAFQ